MASDQSEYGFVADADKTVPKEPRPLTEVRNMKRAEALTGDKTGNSPTDRGFTWNGLDIDRYRTLGVLADE